MVKEKKLQPVCAIDLGGTWIKGALVNQQGQILERQQLTTEAARGAEHIATNIATLAVKLQQTNAAKPASLAAAIPGVIDRKKGLVLNSPNLPLLNGVEFRQLLRRKTKLSVHIENDANCAAVGESWLGSGKKIQSFVLFTLGTGVGGGIIIDNRLWTGESGRAAEIGHLTIEAEGQACGCGSQGCLETISSLRGMQNMLKGQEQSDWYAKHLAAQDPDCFPEVIGRLAAAGDAHSVKIIERFGRALGIAVADILNILDIHTFVFGGGIANLLDLFADQIVAEVARRVYAFPIEKLKLMQASRGQDAGLLGAAKLAMES